MCLHFQPPFLPSQLFLTFYLCFVFWVLYLVFHVLYFVFCILYFVDLCCLMCLQSQPPIFFSRRGGFSCWYSVHSEKIWRFSNSLSHYIREHHIMIDKGWDVFGVNVQLNQYGFNSLGIDDADQILLLLMMMMTMRGCSDMFIDPSAPSMIVNAKKAFSGG